MPDLDQLERWMHMVIANMGGARAGVDSPEARNIIDVTAEEAEQVVVRSRALTGLERLEIYNRAYFARLLECMREEFPAFVHAVGEEAFAEFAVDYLNKHPSKSYTLNELGTRFPLYLAETRPGDEGRKKKGASWPDFLIDLATLELTYGKVFDGPGVEGKPLLASSDLSAITPERWMAARLVPVCCLKLVRMRFPVHRYVNAVRKKREAVFPKPRATYLAVTRRDFVVRRYVLSRTQLELLEALTAGQTVGEALAKVAGSADNLERLASRLGKWFHNWTAEGFFQGVELPP
jgi:Putative DNA-binding domain